MNDKQFTRFVMAAGLALIAWRLFAPKTGTLSPGNLEMQPPNLSPDLAAFSANPAHFMPSNINVDIGNQGYSFLSNAYMPLFGFVGMAQGSLYQ